MLQLTCWFDVPPTVAANRWLSPGASVALGGEMLTTTCGRIVTLADVNCVASPCMVTRNVTGFVDGIAAGAR
jgi:hypothetical protein